MASLPLNDFGDRMVELLPKLMKEIGRYENNYVTTGKITMMQLVVMDCLSRRGECQMNKMVQAMNVSFSTATGMIDRLVKQNLVRRIRGESDRRTVLVTITLKGRKVLSEIYEQKHKGIVRLFSRLSSAERVRYLEILEKLADNLSNVQSKGA